jgi:hypothetical protein
MTKVIKIESAYTATVQPGKFFDDIQDELGADVLDETEDEIVSTEGRITSTKTTRQDNKFYTVTQQ